MQSSSVCLSPSVCLSVTSWYCLKIDKRRMTQKMCHDNTGTPVFLLPKISATIERPTEAPTKFSVTGPLYGDPCSYCPQVEVRARARTASPLKVKRKRKVVSSWFYRMVVIIISLTDSVLFYILYFLTVWNCSSSAFLLKYMLCSVGRIVWIRSLE